MRAKVVILGPKDNVATTLQELRSGDELELGNDLTVKLLHDIPFGHKFSIAAIPRGKSVIKYGEVIGTADKAIAPGDYVHIHNVISTRGREEKKR